MKAAEEATKVVTAGIQDVEGNVADCLLKGDAVNCRETRLLSRMLGGAFLAALLAKCPRATKLDVKRARLTAGGLRGLAEGLPGQGCGLEEIDVSDNGSLLASEERGAALAALLAKCPRATKLSVWSTGLTAGGLRSLAEGLPGQGCGLEEIDVSHNGSLLASEEGVAALAALLAKCPRATKLSARTGLTAGGLRGALPRGCRGRGAAW